MSKRLQVVMTDGEFREVERAAAAARTTVSEWVRQSLREARRKPGEAREPASAVVRERARRYGDLLERVMERYGLPDEDAAVRFALRRAAEPPLSREEILALEGAGWEGDLDDLRRGGGPEAIP
jgi:hypothetical protein